MNDGYPQRDNQNGGYQRNNTYQRNGGGNGGGYNRGGGFQKGGGGWQGRNQNGQGGNKGFQQREWTEEELRDAHLSPAVVLSGNDNVPDNVMLMIERLVKAMEDKNISIRCGALRGVDQVVVRSAKKPELHIPFRGFDQIENPASYYTTTYCQAVAKKFMPDLESLPKGIVSFYAKNPRLIGGKNLDKLAQLVIVWSEDGCQIPSETGARSGMAGHLVKLACSVGIPVINLQRADAEQRVMHFLSNLYVEPQQAHQQVHHQAAHSGDSNPGTYHGPRPGTPGGVAEPAAGNPEPARNDGHLGNHGGGATQPSGQFHGNPGGYPAGGGNPGFGGY